MCLLDLPSIQIIELVRYFFLTDSEKELRKAAKEKEEYKKKSINKKTKSQVITRNQEKMLRKFKSAIAQAKQSDTKISPNHSKTEIYKDFYF